VSRIFHASRWSFGVIGLTLISSGAPSCVPAPAASPPPAATPTIQPGTLTVVYDGAGPGAARIGLIGDSTMAALRWANAYAPLERWNFTYDAESCRRTITPSCHGSDGYAPATGIDTMRRLSGRLGTVLVMMEGANDPANRFGEGIDTIVAEAQAQGIRSVIWLTIHGFDQHNAILAQRAQQDGGYLVVADWAGYIAGHPEWTISDGLHVSSAGAPVLAQFIADNVAQVMTGL
jgi:hypothetical protein